MPAKICCDNCREDVDIRYKNEIYCNKCYGAVIDQIEKLYHPAVTCQNCNCDVDFDCDEGYCEDCYENLKKENKELKEELSRLQKIVKIGEII